jgi:hypothetical protein
MEKKLEQVYLVYKKDDGNSCSELLGICVTKERANYLIGLPKECLKKDKFNREYYELRSERRGKIGKVNTITYFWIETKKITY